MYLARWAPDTLRAHSWAFMGTVPSGFFSLPQGGSCQHRDCETAPPPAPHPAATQANTAGSVGKARPPLGHPAAIRTGKPHLKNQMDTLNVHLTFQFTFSNPRLLFQAALIFVHFRILRMMPPRKQPLLHGVWSFRQNFVVDALHLGPYVHAKCGKYEAVV